MNRKRWIALLLALACLLLAGCQKQSAEDLQTPDDESDVVGDDWRTWGWINDWGTIVVDGEMIDVLLCVFTQNAVLYYDDATQVEFADLHYPYELADAEESYDSLTLLDQNGDDVEDIRLVFIHDDGMQTEFIWCWDDGEYVFSPELSGESAAEFPRGTIVTEDMSEEETQEEPELTPEEETRQFAGYWYAGEDIWLWINENAGWWVISENGDMIDRGDFTFDGEALYLNMLGYGFIGRLLPQGDGSLLEENSELEYVWVAESDVPEAVLTAPLE